MASSTPLEDSNAGAPQRPRRSGSRGRTGTLWALSVLPLLPFAAVTAFVVDDLQFGDRPAFIESARSSSSGDHQQPQPLAAAPIRLAGAGCSLPLARSLVEGWQPSMPAEQLVVHEEIGSSGAIQAVRDRAIHVGLVSRPLDERERAGGLVVTPFARIAVVLVAHRSVEQDDVSSAELLALYGGSAKHGSNPFSGRLHLREAGSSDQLAMARALPGFADASDRAYRDGRGRVVYRAQDMQAALEHIPGAVGLFDLGVATARSLPIRVLSLDGVMPSLASLESGDYRVSKDLCFVTAGQPEGEIAALLDFVFSPAGQQRIRDAGYLPLPRSGS